MTLDNFFGYVPDNMAQSHTNFSEKLKELLHKEGDFEDDRDYDYIKWYAEKRLENPELAKIIGKQDSIIKKYFATEEYFKTHNVSGIKEEKFHEAAASARFLNTFSNYIVSTITVMSIYRCFDNNPAFELDLTDFIGYIAAPGMILAAGAIHGITNRLKQRQKEK